jgi:hypothetical protein
VKPGSSPLAHFSRSLAVACALVLFVVPARAGEEPGSSLRISLLTMSPGDMAFTKFGHDALLVEDTVSGANRVYNYGTFVFGSPWLALDFLRGNLKYWLSVSSLPTVIRHYAAEQRSISAQELRLPPAERARIAELLATTERSDARYYKYDYYRDNCATRVRDVVDRATGGRLRAVSNGPAPFTYREETLRLTESDVLLSLGLDLAMGPLIDRPLTTWDAEFLPARLADAVRTVRIPGPSGDEPLVVAERVLLSAPGRTLATAPPRYWPSLFAAGLALLGVLTSLGVRAGRGSRAARVTLALLLAMTGLVFGVLGSVIVGLFSLTDHAVTYFDANVLLCTPWSIALAVVARGVARGGFRATSRARALTVASLVTSMLALAALPFSPQKNVEFVAFFLPLWLGASLALLLARRPATEPAR